MTVSILSSSGQKIGLAQHLAQKYSASKVSSTILGSFAIPKAGTQALAVLNALWAGHRLTREKAAKELSVYGLSQTIEYLRRSGWPIKTVRKYAVNEFGQLTKRGEYFMVVEHH